MARPGKHLKQLNNRALRRINRAVTAYERGDRDMPPIEPPIPIGDDGGAVRLCKTTGDWEKNTKATLEVWENGSAPSESKTTGQTIEAVNKMRKVPANVFVHVALGANGTWYMIEADSGCSGSFKASALSDTASDGSNPSNMQEGGETQVLVNDGGCAKWFQLTRKEIVTDVSWNNGLVVSKKYVYLFEDPSPSSPVTIIDAQNCPT